MLKEERPEYLEQIFQDIFSVETITSDPSHGATIRPFYRQWMLGGYIRVGSPDLVRQPNVNLSAMLVNKDFRAAGSRIVYGSHMFSFGDARNCLWWCKHIGTFNLHNLKRLSITAESGWDVPVECICDVDQSHEELWTRFFTWLGPRHRLSFLFLSFVNVEALSSVVVAVVAANNDHREQLRGWRRRLHSALYELRGIDDVIIADPGARVLDREDRRTLPGRMAVARAAATASSSGSRDNNTAGQLAPWPSQPHPTLAQILTDRHVLTRMAAQVAARAERKRERKKAKKRSAAAAAATATGSSSSAPS